MVNLFIENKEHCAGVVGEYGVYEVLVTDFNKRNKVPFNNHGGRMCNVCHAKTSTPVCFTPQHRSNGRAVKKTRVECYLVKILEKKDSSEFWGIVKCCLHPLVKFLIWHSTYITSSLSFKMRLIDRFIVNACKILYGSTKVSTQAQNRTENVHQTETLG